MKYSGSDKKKLIDVVNNFGGKKILVVGDVMLDLFVWGSVSRISPEAPVPIVEIRRETSHLGGAANVACNISSLKGHPIVVGVVGDDSAGNMIRQDIERFNPYNGIVVDRGRTTTVKTRIIAQHQQVCRTDREDKSELCETVTAKLITTFNKYISEVDAVIVSDYAKGVVNKTLIAEVLEETTKRDLTLCVDPKVKNFPLYKNVTIITPNQSEAEAVSGIQIKSQATLAEAGKKILAETACRHLLITRGEEGMALFEQTGEIANIPTVAREVFDVTGAGDTVISVLTLSLVSGATVREAALIANHAAGIVVGKLGTAPVAFNELIGSIEKLENSTARVHGNE